MTDGQWLWLFANMSLDDDEKLDSMCPKCRDNATDRSKCSVCGTGIEEAGIQNPKFDKSRFDELNNEEESVSESFDRSKFKQRSE